LSPVDKKNGRWDETDRVKGEVKGWPFETTSHHKIMSVLTTTRCIS
jgi:hypothetical protein